ncbi:MAG: hypothetical protein J3K34DRAFT_369546, partial [Monoraphidium minutum]
LVTGGPGTGKSRVLTAFLWYAFQLRAHDMVRVAAFTWRAADGVTTPSNPAILTYRLFALKRGGGNDPGGVPNHARQATGASNLHEAGIASNRQSAIWR